MLTYCGSGKMQVSGTSPVQRERTSRAISAAASEYLLTPTLGNAITTCRALLSSGKRGGSFHDDDQKGKKHGDK